MQETWVQFLRREDPLEKEMATTPVFLPGESHRQRNLEGYSPWGCKESDTTERLQLVISSNYVYNILKGKIYIEPLTFNLLQPLCIITLFDIPLVSVLSFPCSSVSKQSACNAGDLGSTPESGRSPGEGNGNLL